MRLWADNCGAGFLVGCCGWVVNQDGVLYQDLLEITSMQRGTWCGQLEQEPDGQEASMEVGWATFYG